ncbi:hypothetical protein CNR22_08440 [Sphingobacteriaceae bacterium]|nr:hypothetical protein CNR22_08440 [Sphingobacteriaceae bacterium]
MENRDDIADIKFKSLRHCIGLFGLALPSLVVIQARLVGQCDCLQDSISHYYFTVSAPWFIGILWGLGLVLIFYPTPKPKSNPVSACSWRICRVFRPKLDGTLTSISGIFAICVSLIPTNSNSTDSCAIFQYSDSNIRAGIHYFSAASMLIIFSYMSVCIFTRTNDKNWRENKWKVRRNQVYIWCGVITFLSILTVAALAIMEACHIQIPPKSTYWLEVSALVPFGIAWLVKGGFMLTDEGEPSTLAQAKNLVTKGKIIRPVE